MLTEPLSKYFTWAEVTKSQVAARKHLDNTPPAEVIETIKFTAVNMDQVRVLLAQPVLIDSWYRSQRVNAAVGGKPTSQHLRGEAVDFICPAYGNVQQVFAALRDAVEIKYDQLIVEFNSWVHVSFVEEHARRMAFAIDHTGTHLV